MSIRKFSEFVPPHFRDLLLDFLDEQHSNYWLEGGRGSVKSSITAAMIIIGIMKNPTSHAFCARKHKVDLHGSVYSQIIKTIHILGVADLFKISKADQGAPPITYIPTGQKILFGGLDDPEGVKGSTPKWGIIKYQWYEEIHEMDSMAKLRSINQSFKRGGNERFITFYTYNPPRSKANWVNQESLEVQKNDRFYYSHTNWEMLPEELAINWLGNDFIDEALDIKSRDAATYSHEYLGIPVGYGTDVFGNLKVRVITDDEKKHFGNVAIGLDWGFSVDPAAVVMSHFDTKRKILYIFKEIYSTGLSNYELGLRIRKEMDGYVVVADSAEPKSVSELGDMGVRIMPSKKGKGSVEHGTRNLQGLTEIVIDPVTAPNTAREFSIAEYELDRYGNVVPRVKDKNNHTIDATRYRMELETGGRSGW